MIEILYSQPCLCFSIYSLVCIGVSDFSDLLHKDLFQYHAEVVFMSEVLNCPGEGEGYSRVFSTAGPRHYFLAELHILNPMS